MQHNRIVLTLILGLFTVSLANFALAQGRGGGQGGGGGKPKPNDDSAFTVIDLGALGGEHSEARDINESGQITGRAETSAGNHPAVVWTVDAVGNIIDTQELPTLAPGFGCQGSAINNFGTVVGFCNSGIDEEYWLHGVMWRNGTLIDLNEVYGRPLNIYDINDNEQILAVDQSASNLTIVLHNGSITELPAPFAYGFGMNAQAHVAGQKNDRLVNDVLLNDAVLWMNGDVIELGTTNGGHSYAQALNDIGQVVGGDGIHNSYLHPTMWTVDVDGQVQPSNDLGTLGGDYGWAQDITNKGQVVGHAQTAKNKKSQNTLWFAFFWENGEMINLGTLKFYKHFSEAYAINENSFVVGLSGESSNHFPRATLWVPK